MAIGLVGKKLGMTRIFKEDGSSTPVTVLQVLPNIIAQIKSKDTDKYSALQVTTGTKKPSRVNKAQQGHFAKANITAGTTLCEFRVEEKDLENYKQGDEIPLEIFAVGQKVDVTAVSKGKGFAGTVKRHNFRTQDATHGNSLSHRVPGSIGQNQTPGRVFKGKKMAGQMGNKQVTVQSLEVALVDPEKKLIMLTGAVPGATGASVRLQHAARHLENQ